MADGRDDFVIKVGVDTTEVEHLADDLLAALRRMESLFSGGVPGLDAGSANAQGRRIGESILRGMYQALNTGDSRLARSFIGESAVRRTERDAERIESIIRRTRAIAASSGVSLDVGSMSTAGRADTGRFAAGMRAIEDQANRATRAVTDLNAQLAITTARLASGANYQLSATALAQSGTQRAITNVERRAIETSASSRGPSTAVPGQVIPMGYLAPPAPPRPIGRPPGEVRVLPGIEGGSRVGWDVIARELGSARFDTRAQARAFAEELRRELAQARAGGPRAIEYVPPTGPKTGQNLPRPLYGGGFAPRGGFPALTDYTGREFGEPRYGGAYGTTQIGGGYLELPPVGQDFSKNRASAGTLKRLQEASRAAYEGYLQDAEQGMEDYVRGGHAITALGRRRGVGIGDYFTPYGNRRTSGQWLGEEARGYFGMDSAAAPSTEGMRGRPLGRLPLTYREFAATFTDGQGETNAEAQQRWEAQQRAAYRALNPPLGPSFPPGGRGALWAMQQQQVADRLARPAIEYVPGAGQPRLFQNAPDFAVGGGYLPRGGYPSLGSIALGSAGWQPAAAGPPPPARSSQQNLASRLFESTGRDLGQTQEALKGLGFNAKQVQEATAHLTAAEKELGAARAAGARSAQQAAAAAGGGGRRGGGGGGRRISGGEEEDPFEKFHRFLQDDMGYLGSKEDARTAFQNASYRTGGRKVAAEAAGEGYDRSYDRVYTEAQQKAAESQGRYSARQEYGYTSDEDIFENERAKARRARRNADQARRQEGLRDYLDSEAPFDQKVFSSFRGAAPGTRGASVGGEFKEGFLGSSERLGYQLGQTAKFSLFYGAAYAGLFQLSQGFAMALDQAKQFQDGLAALEIITGRGRQENAAYADSLGEIASHAGFSPGEGLATGVAAIGLYDLGGLDKAEQQRQSLEVTKVATRIARVSGGDASDTAAQLAGVARSFELGPEDSRRIEDTVAVISKRSGAGAADILDALANIGTLGAGAGYDVEELAALLARVQSTTAGTPASAANALRQVFSKADDPNTARKLQALGVDTEGTTLAQQFQQLAGMDLSQAQQNRIVQQFGRGASGQALQILLNQQPEIQGLAGEARAGVGAGEETFKKVMGTIGGVIRQFGGDLGELLKDLASTGVLDTLGVLIKLLDITVVVLDKFVDAFNLLPELFRGGAIGILELVAALTLLARSSGPGSRAAGAAVDFLAGGIGRRRGPRVTGVAGNVVFSEAGDIIGDIVRGGRGPGGRAAGGAVTEGLGAALARLFPTFTRGGAAAATGARAGASALAGLLGVSGLTLGLGAAGVGAVGYGLYKGVQTGRGDVAAARQGRLDALGAGTPDEMRAAAARLRATAKEQDDVWSGIGRWLTTPIGELPEETPGKSRAQAKSLEDRAKVLEEARANAARSAPQSVFGSMDTTEAISGGLQSLAEHGYSAAQQIDLLTGALDNLTTNANAASTSAATIYAGQGEQFAAMVGGAGGKSVKNIIRNLDLQRPDGISLENIPGGVQDQRQALIDHLKDIDPAKLQADIGSAALATLAKRGKDTSKGTVQLSDADVKALEDSTAKVLEADLGPEAWKRLGTEGRRLAIANFTAELRAGLGDYAGGRVTLEGIQGLAAAAANLGQAAGRDVALRTGDSLAGAQAEVGKLQQIQGTLYAAAGAADPKDQLAAYQIARQNELVIAEAQQKVIDGQIARANALAALASSRLHLDDKVGRAANAINALNQAIALTRDPTQLAALEAQRNEAVQQQRLDAYNADAANKMAGINPRRAYERTNLQIATAVGLLGHLTPGSEQWGNTIDQIHEMQARQIAYELDNLAAYTTAEHAVLGRGGTAGSPYQAAVDARADADRRERDARANGDPLEINRTSAAARQAAYAEQMARTEYVNSFYAVAGTSRTASVRTGAALAQAQNRRNTTYRITGDAQLRNEADAALRAAKQADQDARDSDRQSRRLAAVRPGDNIGRSVTLLRNYREELKKYSRGTTEYNNVLMQIAQEQQQLAESQAAFASNLRQLAIDMTDPVTAAMEALQSANEAVARADTPEEKASARVAQKNAQTQLEAAAFQQRLSDAQIADQLGRTSHAAYISYLQSEHDRLSAISVRTRQQQDELDQIDLAIKSETEALTGGGQFNLGDIKVPTPYEVRRMVAAGGGAGVTVLDYSNSNNTVTVNGADMAAVVALITALVSPSATLTPAKVVG